MPSFPFQSISSAAKGQGSIAHKILFYILLFSSFITLIVTFVQLYSDYQEQAELIDQRMVQIERSYHDSLSNAIWFFNAKQIKSILAGIMKFEDVHYAAVQIKNGEAFQLGNKRQSDNLRRYDVDILHNVQGKENQVGRLSIESNLDTVITRLSNKFWSILISQGMKPF